MFIFCNAICSIYIGGFLKKPIHRQNLHFPGLSWGPNFVLPDPDSSSEDELSLCCIWRLLKAEPFALGTTSVEGKRSQCYSTAEPYPQIKQPIPFSYLCVPCAQAGSLKTVTQNHQSGQSYHPDWTGWCSVKIRKTIMGLS